MKCLVCGKIHEAAECPRCSFPDIQIMGDQDKAMESLRPAIIAYRTNFLKTVRLELMTYRWKDQDGQVVLDREERMLLGSGDGLQQETWLPEKFARIADQEKIPVTVRITAGEESRDAVISLPNLHEPQLQQLGAVIDGDCCLRLLLRNDTQEPVSSAPVSLFA